MSLTKWQRYYQKNKEDYLRKKSIYNKKYYQSANGKKSTIINGWKCRGLKEFGYTYDELYEYYLETNECEVCHKDITKPRDRCMDHCHDTGCFRWVLCRECNNNDHWMTYF
jgi:TFIIF-interacting CTD phosphatase-like protein